MAAYDAFISYSHAKDKPIAAALQSVVQKLGKPWYRRRTLRVFRDDTSLSATPHLWPTIEQALNQSRFLIVLASAEAATSPWVNKEVVYWLEHKTADTILIGVTDGELTWDSRVGDFRWRDGTPLPPALTARFASEPKWVDLRAYRDGANPRDAKFIELAADFAATIQGTPKEDLLSQEVRQQRRALTLAWSAAGLLLILAGLATWQWRETTESRRVAVAEAVRAERNFGAAKSTVDAVIFDLAQGLKDIEGMRAETVRRILERAERAVGQLAARTENDPAVLNSQATMFGLFSYTYLRLGDSRLAVDYAQRALKIEREHAAKDPSKAVWWNNLSNSLALVGDALLAQGDLNGALAAHRESLEIRRELVAKDPKNTQGRWATSLSIGKTGRVLMNQNDLPGALALFRESLDIMRELSAKDPRNVIWRNGESAALSDIAVVLTIQGDLASALTHYRESLDINRALSAGDPSDTLLRRNVSVGAGKVAAALLTKGDLNGALALYREGLDIMRELSAKDRGNKEWRADVATFLGAVGGVLKAKGDLQGALAVFREGLDIMRELSTQDPANTQWWANVSASLEDIGNVLRAQGDPWGDALAAYRESLDIMRQVAAKDPGKAVSRANLSASLNNVGDVLRTQGDLNGALVLYREGLDIMRELSAQAPNNAGWRRGISVILNKVGNVLIIQGDLIGAQTIYRESLDIARALAVKDSSNTEWQRDLSVSLNNLGDRLLAQGDRTSALAAYREGYETLRELSAKNPGNVLWQTDVVYSLGKLALTGDDARARLSEALVILTRLKSQGRLPPAQHGWIATIEADLAKLTQADRASSPPVQQIQGTYDGTNTLSQVPGQHQIALTFQQSGSDVTATFRTSLGGRGRGTGTISDNVIGTMSLQSEVANCPGAYTASFTFSGDSVSWTYAGQDCGGPAQGHGQARKQP